MGSLTIGSANKKKDGRNVSGDAFTVVENGQQTTVLLVDGLGSGENAAEAANLAVETVEKNPSMGIVDLMRTIHLALRGTRGAVGALLRIDEGAGKAEYLAVGNINTRVITSNGSIKPFFKNGTLGYRLPSLTMQRYPYNSGDCYILYSDGISNHKIVEEDFARECHPQQLADYIMENFAKDNDDVSVVVVT